MLSIIVTAVTVILSVLAFSNNQLTEKLILWPRRMDSPKEYYRFVTCGFIHADWNHLIFNMLSLYFIAPFAESVLGLGFIPFYLAGIVVSSLPSFIKNRNNYYYRSLGASGGISAIMFFFIYFMPWAKISFMFLPFIQIPAILFGVVYIGYEMYASKNLYGNVNHDAHLWGAAFGFLIGLITDPTHGLSFLNAIVNIG
jgi:membrane associated rhomboid family serine protease